MLEEVNITSTVLTITPFLGALAVTIIICPSIPNWYEKEIKKPKWCPPEDVAIIIWIAFYTLMGYASYLIYRDGGGLDGSAWLPLTLYVLQLILIWISSFIFLGAHNLKWTFYDAILILATNVACCYTFMPINQTAFYLMLPYLAWIIFVTCLSYSTWCLNSCSGSIIKAINRNDGTL